MKSISRRDLIKDALAIPAVGLLGSSFAPSSTSPVRTRLADFGWSWEGQGLTGAPGLSIYGLGEGAEYFGLNRVFNLYRPNDDLAMEKLRSFEEVACEISPAHPIRCGDRCVELPFGVPSPAEMLAEARNVSNLSLRYQNIKGAYIDETLGNDKPSAIITRKLYGSIYSTLKNANPNLKLWALVYSSQLEQEQDWPGFKPHMDVINLWVWDSKDLPNLDLYVDRCREIFPDKPLVLGCFLWDYSSMKFSRGDFEKGHAVPMDLLKLQWGRVLKYIEDRKIDGYTILGAYLIDWAPEQARWVRDFIAAN